MCLFAKRNKEIVSEEVRQEYITRELVESKDEVEFEAREVRQEEDAGRRMMPPATAGRC
jgi:hypothetical protein